MALTLASNAITFTDGTSLSSGIFTSSQLSAVATTPVKATGTTVARKIEDRFSDFLTDKDFGAKGDGIVNDTLPLSAAGATGKTILLTSNKYNFTGVLSGNFINNTTERITYTGSGRFATLGLNFASTDQYFAQNGAVVHRLADRVFVGDAARGDARFPNVQTDWLGTFHSTASAIVLIGNLGSAATVANSPIVTFTAGNSVPLPNQYIYAETIPPGTKILSVDSSTQLTLDTNAVATKQNLTLFSNTTQVLGANQGGVIRSLNNKSPGSGFGGCFGSHSQYFTSAGTSCIGVGGFAVNDNESYATSCWGGYFEAHRLTNAAGGARGIEIDVATIRNEIEPNAFQQSNTCGLQIGAGCGLAGTLVEGDQQNVGAAIQIVANPMSCKTGIVFLSRSIEGTNGYTGLGTAISMAGGHMLEWVNSDEQLVGRIGANPSLSAANKSEIRFTEQGVQFLGANNQDIGYIFTNNNNSVNYFTINGSIANTPIILSTGGDDTNIDFAVNPKGSGKVTPWVDNTTSLGSSTKKWSTIYAANGTIQTSDQREKTDIQPTSLGLEFINNLNPVSYKWIVGGNKALSADEQNIPTAIESVPGRRTHYGLIAQEVKAILPEGVDFGGWVLTDKDNPDSQQALRYDQFIAPLIKAVQELKELNDTQNQTILALENRIAQLEA